MDSPRSEDEAPEESDLDFIDDAPVESASGSESDSASFTDSEPSSSEE